MTDWGERGDRAEAQRDGWKFVAEKWMKLYEVAAAERDEARAIARDMWVALVQLRHDWMNEENMLAAWNRLYCCNMPEYLRRWLRDSR